MGLDLLHDCRVVEFTHVWAGPYCGQVLADLGAEVIKVESRAHVDVHRRAGPYAGRERGIDRSGVWNAQNRGKLGCTINLSEPEGVAIASRLVGLADIVLDNFSPGALARRGLSYESLAAVNPCVVLVSLTGYGLDGPWRDFPAYGPMMDGVSGLAWSLRDDEGHPRSVNGWFPDTAAALHAAGAALAAVRHARQTGTGRQFDVAELAAATSLLPELVALSSLADRNADVHGNDAPGALLAGTFATRRDKDWLWLRVDRTKQWSALGEVLAADPLPPPGSAAAVGAVADSIRQRDRREVCATLQSRSIEALPVLSAADLDADEHLGARGAFVETDHVELGVVRSYGPWARLLGRRPVGGRPAPTLGQHNDEVFTSLLGIPEDEVRRLEAASVLW